MELKRHKHWSGSRFRKGLVIGHTTNVSVKMTRIEKKIHEAIAYRFNALPGVNLVNPIPGKVADYVTSYSARFELELYNISKVYPDYYIGIRMCNESGEAIASEVWNNGELIGEWKAQNSFPSIYEIVDKHDRYIESLMEEYQVWRIEHDMDDLPPANVMRKALQMMRSTVTYSITITINAICAFIGL